MTGGMLAHGSHVLEAGPLELAPPSVGIRGRTDGSVLQTCSPTSGTGERAQLSFKPVAELDRNVNNGG